MGLVWGGGQLGAALPSTSSWTDLVGLLPSTPRTLLPPTSPLSLGGSLPFTDPAHRLLTRSSPKPVAQACPQGYLCRAPWPLGGSLTLPRWNWQIPKLQNAVC